MTAITEAKILIVATDGFEQSELTVPLKHLRDRGATVMVTAPDDTREVGKIQGWRGDLSKAEWGDFVDVDYRLDSIEVDDFDALVIPGGVMNPDKLRANPQVVQLVKDFVSAGKVVAAVCHGPWLLVEADVVNGRRVTSFHSIKTDVKNAGGDWVDEMVVSDNGIITSRNPGDLPAFVDKICEEIAEGEHPRGVAATVRHVVKDLM